MSDGVRVVPDLFRFVKVLNFKYDMLFFNVTSVLSNSMSNVTDWGHSLVPIFPSFFPTWAQRNEQSAYVCAISGYFVVLYQNESPEEIYPSDSIGRAGIFQRTGLSVVHFTPTAFTEHIP